MRLNQLQYLIALDRYKTFSRAAEALYLAQPSISVAVRELEEELHCSILIRSNRGVSFTEQGRKILAHAYRVMQEMDAIKECAAGSALQGTVRICGTPHFCNSLLMDVQLQAGQRYPGITMEIFDQDSEGALHALLDKRVELAIIQDCDLRPSEIDPARLRSIPLFEEQMCFVCGESHPLRGKAGVSMRELVRYPYATFCNSVNRTVAQLQKTLPGSGGIIHINEIVTLRQFIVRSDAYTMIPRRAVLCGNQIYKEPFYELDVADVSCHSQISCVTLARELSPQEQRVLEVLQERCLTYGAEMPTQ